MSLSWAIWGESLAIAPRACVALVNGMIQGAIVVVVAAVVVRVWPLASAARRHIVWAVACCSLLLLPVLSSVMPGCHVRMLSEPVGVMLILGGWVSGMLVVLAVLVNGHVRAQRLLSNAPPLADARMLDVFARAVETLRLTRPVPVKLHVSAMPMVCGVIRPVMVLPVNANTWSDDRLYNIFVHELAHIKRHDSLIQTVASLTCAFYWFNPLVWLAVRELLTEQEQACDDVVLTAGSHPHMYASDLLELMQAFQSLGTAQLALLSFVRSAHLQSRIEAIIDRPRRRSRVSRWQAFAVCSAGLGMLYPVAKLTPPIEDRVLSVRSHAPCRIASAPRHTEPPRTDRAPSLKNTGVSPAMAPGAVVTKGTAVWMTLSSKHGKLRGRLPELLKAEIRKAKMRGRTPFLEVGATWCPTCVALETSFQHADMLDAFAGTYIVHLDVNDWDLDSDLAPLGFTGRVIPAILAIDSSGQVTSEFAGTAAARPIKQFLRAHLW